MRRRCSGAIDASRRFYLFFGVICESLHDTQQQQLPRRQQLQVETNASCCFILGVLLSCGLLKQGRWRARPRRVVTSLLGGGGACFFFLGVMRRVRRALFRVLDGAYVCIIACYI